MERLTEADLEGNVDRLVTELIEGSPVADADMPERIDAEGNITTDESGIFVDHCDRQVVSYYQDRQGRWKPTALKVGDDVICAGIPLRVVAPARGRGYFSGYYSPWFGETLVPIEARYVTERAPLDPNETPMPIIPDEEVTP